MITSHPLFDLHHTITYLQYGLLRHFLNYVPGMLQTATQLSVPTLQPQTEL